MIGEVIEGKRNREVFHLLVHLHNSQSQEPGDFSPSLLPQCQGLRYPDPHELLPRLLTSRKLECEPRHPNTCCECPKWHLNHNINHLPLLPPPQPLPVILQAQRGKAAWPGDHSLAQTSVLFECSGPHQKFLIYRFPTAKALPVPHSLSLPTSLSLKHPTVCPPAKPGPMSPREATSLAIIVFGHITIPPKDANHSDKMSVQHSKQHRWEMMEHLPKGGDRLGKRCRLLCGAGGSQAGN